MTTYTKILYGTTTFVVGLLVTITLTYTGNTRAEIVDIQKTLDVRGEEMATIKANLNNLPTDIASQSELLTQSIANVDAKTQTLADQIKDIDMDLKGISAQVGVISTKLDILLSRIKQ